MTPLCTAASDAAPVRFTARAQIIAGACACGAFSAFLFAVDPSRHAVYPRCLFHEATGLYCAGCGATRALHALLHGRVLEALHDNALFVAVLPLVLFLVGRFALDAWRADAWPAVHVEGRTVARTGAAVFLVTIAFAIARNLPGTVFDWLRPL